MPAVLDRLGPPRAEIAEHPTPRGDVGPEQPLGRVGDHGAAEVGVEAVAGQHLPDPLTDLCRRYVLVLIGGVGCRLDVQLLRPGVVVPRLPGVGPPHRDQHVGSHLVWVVRGPAHDLGHLVERPGEDRRVVGAEQAAHPVDHVRELLPQCVQLRLRRSRPPRTPLARVHVKDEALRPCPLELLDESRGEGRPVGQQHGPLPGPVHHPHDLDDLRMNEGLTAGDDHHVAAAQSAQGLELLGDHIERLVARGIVLLIAVLATEVARAGGLQPGEAVVRHAPGHAVETRRVDTFHLPVLVWHGVLLSAACYSAPPSIHAGLNNL